MVLTPPPPQHLFIMAEMPWFIRDLHGREQLLPAAPLLPSTSSSIEGLLRCCYSSEQQSRRHNL
jgi:hypothetical protein